MKDLAIFSGNSNKSLAEDICKNLHIELGKASCKRFSDGEIAVKIEENVRGRDVFVVQSISYPANDNLMELLLMIDALRRASARRITAVIPYYGYGRQDRKVEPRVPISARMVADLIQVTGPNRVLTMDLHADQIQGFFHIPVDHLFFSPVMYDYLGSKNLQDLVVVSPDSGGAERARFLGKKLNASLAIIDKRRPQANESVVMHIIGDIQNKNCLILDDMMDTAGTTCKAASALLANGAKSVMCCATHGVLSGKAMDNLNSINFKEIVLSNSINIPSEKKINNLTVLSVAPLFAKAIQRIHNEESISSLFL
ncbi:MAG TPA: ribose-phosphate pyrophosphokinase [Leptospiraceae bacterium]|nr:ribose-phosphate pyrophosphokinase [Leptospiraceae bacterium]HMY67970.1 ribose-phosphate pyrophosphokinase [Leptospiraceae bacterium]HMZ60624.1 ribose-phosphate pyrophosphokinase [Leptospiraceae bacterium]HNF12499.1 ribose-phosphate pyrophosphokinase [Leptospiraceae bacterium]HNF24712.1 ribose-phosphate pyrophosphokinase [Leptospiraceae bacterium]